MGSMKQLRYLNLSNSLLGGMIPNELGNLTNLRVLDMDSVEIAIKDGLGWVTGLKELRHLNLNEVNMIDAHDWVESLIGPLPYIKELHLSYCGLTTLYKTTHKNSSFLAHLPIRYIDLSGNNFNGEIISIIQNNLISLEHLDLSFSIRLTQYDSWSLWDVMHNLCNLKSLYLSDNYLVGNFLPPRQNLSNNCRNRYELEELFIIGSSVMGDIPGWLGDDFRSLRFIDLSSNFLSGEIPASLGKLSNLKVINLSDNNLSSIASSLRFPTKLESLILGRNQLCGKIPKSLGKLSNMYHLDLSINPFEGTVLSEPHFANLSSLIDLDMNETFLTLNTSSNWVPPFQLQYFNSRTCKINGQFPSWLQTQKSISRGLYLPNANISGIMPRWFHTMQQFDDVDLSNNNLTGSPIFPISFSTINLSNNSLSGEFLANDSETKVYGNASTIDLSHNFIIGPFPERLAQIMPNLRELFLYNNRITGPLPNSLCQFTSLEILDIENNSLKGVIPNCLSNISSISLLNLSYNKLVGHIPCFNNTYSYYGLHLNDNMLRGEIPSCFSNLPNLNILDVGGNMLTGKMLNWFNADKFGEMQILRLRGNTFSGTIPMEICSLPHLQIMDLGHNRFTGSIPRCLANLTAMALAASHDLSDNDHSDVSEVIQGIERAYTTTLGYLVDIDLSCNNLVGPIPTDITKMAALLSLNLSYNQLSGIIPENIGNMKSLIALDLSNNKLRGSIPTSMGEIFTLSALNLSYNNLSGQIPTGDQLQTLSDPASIYAGNPYLCADFLPRKCDNSRRNGGRNGMKEKLVKMGFYMVVMSGFATGFWCVVGCLALNRRWRIAFFKRLEDGYNWLYVMVALRARAVKAKINRR